MVALEGHAVVPLEGEDLLQEEAVDVEEEVVVRRYLLMILMLISKSITPNQCKLIKSSVSCLFVFFEHQML